MLAGGSTNTLSTSAMVLVYYIYQNAFNYWKLGYSSAIAMVLFVLVLGVTSFNSGENPNLPMTKSSIRG